MRKEIQSYIVFALHIFSCFSFGQTHLGGLAPIGSTQSSLGSSTNSLGTANLATTLGATSLGTTSLGTSVLGSTHLGEH